MLIQATRTVRYKQREYRAGQTFEALAQEARLLKALKRAIDAPMPAESPVVEVAPVVPMTTENSEPIAPVRRGRYARRDMRGVDSSSDFLDNPASEAE